MSEETLPSVTVGIKEAARFRRMRPVTFLKRAAKQQSQIDNTDLRHIPTVMVPRAA